MDVEELIYKHSGLPDSLLNDDSRIEPQGKMGQILGALYHVHRGKGVLYGNFINNKKNSPELLAIIEHYCDIKRKWVRINNIIHKLSNFGPQNPVEEISESDLKLALFETYTDLAVYSAMGLELIHHYIYPADEPEAVCDNGEINEN